MGGQIWRFFSSRHKLKNLLEIKFHKMMPTLKKEWGLKMKEFFSQRAAGNALF